MFRALILALLAFPMVANAQLWVSAYSVNFWNTPVGSYGMTQTIYVQSNIQTSVMVTSGCYLDFQISNFCYQLSPNQQCMIQIRFSPSRPGYQSCNMSISDQHGSYQTVNISGDGVQN